MEVVNFMASNTAITMRDTENLGYQRLATRTLSTESSSSGKTVISNDNNNNNNGNSTNGGRNNINCFNNTNNNVVNIQRRERVHFLETASENNWKGAHVQRDANANVHFKGTEGYRSDRAPSPAPSSTVSAVSECTRNLRDRSTRQRIPVKKRQKRQTMQSMSKPLKKWLCKNRRNPYPTRQEKLLLAKDANMDLQQVNNWFANARRRLKQTVQGDNLTWSKRVEKYNSNVTGNAELLSLSSEDSYGESEDDDTMEIKTCAEGTSLTPPPSEPREEKDVVPSRSHTPTFHTDTRQFYPPHNNIIFNSTFSDNSYGSHKYKKDLMHRYLSSCSQNHDIDNFDVTSAAFNNSRYRRPSGSIGSRDYEEMSTSSGVETSDNYNSYPACDDAGLYDDLEAVARRRRISGDVRRKDEDMNAAIALMSLSKTTRRNYHT